MENEIKINEIEVTKLDIQPGQVLAISVYADDVSQDDLNVLRKYLQRVFPNNKVILFGLPLDGKMEMSIIDPNLEEESTQEKATNCSEPMSYCNNCTCGKKERIEGEQT